MSIALTVAPILPAPFHSAGRPIATVLPAVVDSVTPNASVASEHANDKQ
jgi:hypothetical protein